MALYGKYDVIRYPGGYAVTDMQTHQWMHTELIGDRTKAHALARKLAEQDNSKLGDLKPCSPQ